MQRQRLLGWGYSLIKAEETGSNDSYLPPIHGSLTEIFFSTGSPCWPSPCTYFVASPLNNSLVIPAHISIYSAPNSSSLVPHGRYSPGPLGYDAVKLSPPESFYRLSFSLLIVPTSGREQAIQTLFSLRRARCS